MASSTQEKDYVVCDLGSTHIAVMLANKSENGCIIPRIVQREPSNNAISQGCIYNLDASINIIEKLIRTIEMQMITEGSIKKIYIGINSRSMYTKGCEVSIKLSEDGEVVTGDHISAMRKKVGEVHISGYKSVMVIDPKFFVDDKPEQNPKGVRCSTLRARYQIVLVREDVIDNIYYVIEDKLKLKVAGILVNPIAEAYVSLSKEEVALGSAFVNIGGGVTSVSIFKDRLLSSMYILPVGGQNVTKDLTSLKILPDDAERLKINKASIDLSVSRSQNVELTSSSGTTKKIFPQYKVNKIVLARMNEITMNVFSIIAELGYDNDLSAGLIISGGATKIKDYENYLNDAGVEYRKAKVRPELIDVSVDDKSLYEDITLIGLATMASENCVEYAPKDIEEMFNTIDDYKDNDNQELNYDDEESTVYTDFNTQQTYIDEDWTNEEQDEKDSSKSNNEKGNNKPKKKYSWMKDVFWDNILNTLNGK